MMSSVIDKIATINFHKFQKLNSNGYEQNGNKFNSCIENKKQNSFVTIPRTRSSVSSQYDNYDAMTSVLEKVVFLCENGERADVAYKERFFESISDEVYKSVTKRYHMLKKNMFEFIYETKYALPAQKEIIFLLCNILKTNLIITMGNEYYKYVDDAHEKTILINDRKSRVYDSCEMCEIELSAKGYYEHLDLDKLKVSELKEYAKRYGMDLSEVGGKKKDDLIAKIKECKDAKK